MPLSTLTHQITQLKKRLDEISLRDAFFLRRKITNYFKKPSQAQGEAIQKAFEEALSRCLDRQLQRPNTIDFNDDLPVVERKSEIATIIAKHQVTIIAGETGSGKTTQLPKICLELGLGRRGWIGHTQPRRLAARAVATRIAQELSCPLGDLVGYAVRFNDVVSDKTVIKLMTDGILLSELQHDKYLLKYDTLIIDEAHERSLNIDFILGYIKQILPKRPDLKVIITSATIDVERFSRHFNSAPIIEVSGRTYPVETRYRPMEERDEEDQETLFQPIIDAVYELEQEGLGDILIFLTGEKEIRDVAEVLNKENFRLTEVVPLYARLSAQEQNKIFQPHNGRRIILATNVAETSLTIPNIRYVIDTGFARISRYSYRSKVQRLPIEPISQASANQRKGRCGRTSNGICIRLYSEMDYLQRPLFTDPEILRTNLASVVLKMYALNLGDIAQFPFIDQPDLKFINDGLQLLEELGAIPSRKATKLTQVGVWMSQFPIEPRLAKMLITAKEENCLSEMIIIAAALAIQDPREYPLEKKQRAHEVHHASQHEQSDFLTFLTLWSEINDQKELLTHKQFRQFCQRRFLNYLRLREWQDVYQQIEQMLRQLRFKMNSEPAKESAIHKAILSGLLSHIGMKEQGSFQFIGARSIKFSLFPTSALFKKPPKWCVANELVETTKLWGRVIAHIEPEWIEPLASHLVKRSYSDPHWSKKAGAVLAKEKVTLYGLPIVTDRSVSMSTIDPVLCRTLFIQHALVAGEWESRLPFYHHNQQLIENIEQLEHKTRRQDILISDQRMFELYDACLPEQVLSTVTLNSWWKTASEHERAALHFSENDLLNSTVSTITLSDFPDEWQYGTITLPIQYHFDVNQKRDGVTIDIPLFLLNQMDDETPFTWQVPGFRHAWVVALIKSLPKALRRHFVPAPNYATAFLEHATPYQEPMITALTQFFLKRSGIRIDPSAWQWDQIPDYLKINFNIIDEQKKTLAHGKSLMPLKRQLAAHLQERLTEIAQTEIQTEAPTQATTWDFGDIPKIHQKATDHYQLKVYPSLIDKQTHVEQQFVNTPAEQHQSMRTAVRRLLFLDLPSPVRYLHDKLPNKSKLGLYFAPLGKVEALIDDIILCALDQLIDAHELPFTESDYQTLLQYAKSEINETVLAIAVQVEKILTLHYALQKKLKGRVGLHEALSYSDIKHQLSALIYPHFISESGAKRLPDLYRYLTAIDARLEKVASNSTLERKSMLVIEAVTDRWKILCQKREELQIDDAACEQVRWMIEELRINLFTQQIKTPYPISEKRINQHIESLLHKKSGH